jgi:hypothetical protein
MDDRKINIARHLMKDPTNNANQVANTLAVSRATLDRHCGSQKDRRFLGLINLLN